MYQESEHGHMTAGSAAAEKVKLPAIFLMITAGIGALLAVISLFANLLGTGLNMAEMGGGSGGQQYLSYMSGGMGVFVNLLGLVMAGVVFFGASKMMKLENYGLAVASSVIAMIPCVSPCCLMGLPIGIWALVVLLNNEVKTAFH